MGMRINLLRSPSDTDTYAWVPPGCTAPFHLHSNKKKWGQGRGRKSERGKKGIDGRSKGAREGEGREVTHTRGYPTRYSHPSDE